MEFNFVNIPFLALLQPCVAFRSFLPQPSPIFEGAEQLLWHEVCGLEESFWTKTVIVVLKSLKSPMLIPRNQIPSPHDLPQITRTPQIWFGSVQRFGHAERSDRQKERGFYIDIVLGLFPALRGR